MTTTRISQRLSTCRHETVVLGQRMRALRLHFGFTLQEIADTTGHRHQNIQRMEVGHTTIRAIDLYKIARLYKISIAEFFEKPIAMPPPAGGSERLSENA